MLEILQYPFMIRALLAGGLISVILGWLGTFVVTKKMSFIGDGVAHASLAGIALAILLGWAPIPTAMVLSVFIAAGIYFLEKKTNLSGDMAIAIIFTMGMALGVVMLHFYSGYQPELISYLFGNILAVSWTDLKAILAGGIIILGFLAIFNHRILFATFDPIGAHLSGKKPGLYDLLLYIATAVSIILSIKLVGMVLVSALLVIPSAISRLFATSFKKFIIIAVIASFLIVVLGLIVSYYLDLPSGATIILFGGLMLLLSYLGKSIINKARA